MYAYEQHVVIDLEFTKTPSVIAHAGLRYEVIEIGAVRLDARGREVDSFSMLVRPQYAERVAPKVAEITGIRTSDLVEAKSFEEALAALAAWVGNARTRMVGWSKNDRNQIAAECAFKGIERPAQLGRWMDLQRVYPRLMGLSCEHLMPLRRAADWCGTAFDHASAHRALYDARVAADLMGQLLSGDYLEQKALITASSLKSKPASMPTTAKLGSMCGELEKLLQSMLAQPQAGVCAA